MSTETIKQKFYGWRMIVGANLVDFFSAGLAFYAYAVFFGFIQEEFSASRFLVSLTVSDYFSSWYLFATFGLYS